MVGWIEEGLGRFEGLDDNDIAIINKELPDLENLISVVQSHMAQLNRVLALLTVAQKLIQKQRELTPRS